MRLRLITRGVAVCVALGGCQTVQTPPARDLVSVSVVLNQLKDELNAFNQTKPTVKPNTGRCYNGKDKMDLVAFNATATLNAVASRENNPFVGLAAPLGLLTFDPSYSGAYSKSQTQSIVVPLAVEGAGEAQPIAPGPHALAAALSAFRDEILRVDHDKSPCLQYVNKGDSRFKVSIAFDVVKKTNLGVELQLAVFKVGDKETLTSEAHQTLDIELGLTPVDAPSVPLTVHKDFPGLDELLREKKLRQ